jgi:hypothetical protein
LIRSSTISTTSGVRTVTESPTFNCVGSTYLSLECFLCGSGTCIYTGESCRTDSNRSPQGRNILPFMYLDTLLFD